MTQCNIPPKGWRCTRGAGHTGPCAPWPVSVGELAQRGEHVAPPVLPAYRHAYLPPVSSIAPWRAAFMPDVLSEAPKGLPGAVFWALAQYQAARMRDVPRVKAAYAALYLFGTGRSVVVRNANGETLALGDDAARRLFAEEASRV